MGGCDFDTADWKMLRVNTLNKKMTVHGGSNCFSRWSYCKKKV